MILLKPFEILYSTIVSAKNFLYDFGFAQPIALNVPVISVGNLSVGGTGKTPCVVMLASELSKTKKVVVISRSYKANLKEPGRVDLQKPSAWKVFGDESCLLQQMLPNCIVWAGPSKSKTAMAALVDKPDVILVDDGFSHRRLKRNIDIVLIDATRGFDYMRTLPSGRLREKLSNLRRAQIVIMTKTNLTTPGQVERMTHFLLKEVPALKGNLFYATSENKLSLPDKSKLYAFCGIGNPKAFLESLNQMGHQIVEEKFFKDHQQYSQAEQNKILKRYLELKKDHPQLFLVTTVKDAIKITNANLYSELKIVDNNMNILPLEKEQIFEKIGTIL